MEVRRKRVLPTGVMIAGFPGHGWLGIVLIFTFWAVNWFGEGLRTHWAFFPLWFGYCLLLDGLTIKRKGNSLLTRNWRGFISLFIISIPSWWLFEAFNKEVHYWHYTHLEAFSDFSYFFWSSLCFSTVLPAIFETSEWIGTFHWLQSLKKGPRIGFRHNSIIIMFLLGILSLLCIFRWPQYSLALLWISVYFLIDPINYWLGNRTLVQNTAYSDWREVIALWVASLCCGFFWEMWNFLASPKWIYSFPYLNFWHIFEMPALGYLGYLPFSLELFALFHLAVSGKSRLQYYLQILPE